MDKDKLDAVEHLLGKQEIPYKKRQGIRGAGVCFGAGGVMEFNVGQVHLVRALNQLLGDAAAQACPGFSWNALQVNKNTVAEPHVDDGAIGRTAVLLLGCFEGG